MKDQYKTKQKLIEELEALRKQVTKLEGMETKRKQMEEVLRASEEKYRLLAETAREIIVFLDLEGNLKYVNRTGLEISGYSEEEALKMNIADILPPDQLEGLRQRLAKRLAGDKDYFLYEAEFINKAGMRIPVEVSSSLVTEKGNPKAVLLTARDITERKRVEERLESLNECLVSFGSDPIENINHLVALCGEQLRGTCALYNRLENGLLHSVGQWNTPPDFASVDKPDGHICFDLIQSDSSEACVIRNLQQTTYAQTDSNVSCYNLKTYIGKTVSFRDTIIGSLCVVYQEDYIPSEDDKNFLGIVASGIGVEEKRRHAEEALLFTRFSVDNAADTMVCVDHDARFIDVNDAFCRSSGYSREELLSMTVHDIDPDYSAEIWPEFWKKLKQSGSLIFESCHRTKEGRIFPVEITANYLEYNGKEYHCSFARDITERKRAEVALKKSEERFHTSVETLLEGFAILSAVRDSHGQIIDFKFDYINEAGCKMNQKPLEEHMGKTLLELFPTHKEIGLFDEYVRVVETGQSLTKEFLIYETVYGSGERLRQAFEVRITRLGDGFVTTWQDITDKKKGEELLKQSEERLKLLIENSKDVVIMADLEGSAMYYNGPPEYGITAEEVLGKNPFNIFEPAIAASLMNQLKLVIKGGEALTY